jgi:uncharacterized phiE125 gp8 family phage protein
MSYDVSMVTPPDGTAIEIADAAAFLRQTDPTELEAIAGFVAAATELAQEFCGQQFIRATRLQKFDCWGDLVREGLAYPPLVQVTSVKYLDEAGSEQTLNTALYSVHSTKKPGRIEPAYNATWPSHQGVSGAIRVTYICGYGLAASDVPATIRTALMQMVRAMYDPPDDSTAGASGNVKLIGFVLGDTVKALLHMAGRYGVL